MRRVLCHCLVVDEREVLRAILAGARTVEQVGDACEAGTGCGSCRPLIQGLLERSRRLPAGLPAQLALWTPSGGAAARRQPDDE